MCTETTSPPSARSGSYTRGEVADGGLRGGRQALGAAQLLEEGVVVGDVRLGHRAIAAEHDVERHDVDPVPLHDVAREVRGAVRDHGDASHAPGSLSRLDSRPEVEAMSSRAARRRSKPASTRAWRSSCARATRCIAQPRDRATRRWPTWTITRPISATELHDEELDETAEIFFDEEERRIAEARRALASGHLRHLLACGRQIEAQRLDAVPEAVRCLDDQRHFEGLHRQQTRI